MTELAFLMELFLDEELPKNTRLKIKDRIREVESLLESQPMSAQHQIAPRYDVNPIVAKQQPSMQRLMQNNPDLIPQSPMPVTPAAAQALAARQALIDSRGAEPGRKSPRKV